MPSQKEYEEARLRERVDHAAFVRRFADDRYRPLQGLLLDDFRDMNTQFFGGRLVQPHIDFAYTPPRSLVTCKETDGSGGGMLITVNDGVVFGTRPGVLRPWPSEGAGRLIRDLFKQGALQQWGMEGLTPEERERHSFDALLAREATRIGISLSLAQVFARNRRDKKPRPLAKFWPCCVRPKGYYLGAISRDLEEDARGKVNPRRPLTTPSLGVLELIRHLLARGRAQYAQDLLDRHMEWLRMFERGRRRQIPQPAEGFEEMKTDTDGSVLGEVSFDQAWLEWNGGTVDLMARSIRRHRSYAELPILADALEEAGCKEGKLLRHLREKVAHHDDCWALRFVLALDEGEEDCCGADAGSPGEAP